MSADVKLVHVCAMYPMAGDTLRRHSVAGASWVREYNRTGKWVCAWLYDKDLKRTSKDVGDPRGVPFVRDLLDHAASKCRENDIVVLTNTDNSFVAGITERLLEASIRGPIYSHRTDFPRLERILTIVEALKGRVFPGWDCFAIPHCWWLKHRDEMPDAVVGSAGWDACLHVLCRKYGGSEIIGAVVHESHPPFWAKRENRHTHPGQLWNAKVIHPFLLAHGWSKADCERYA